LSYFPFRNRLRRLAWGFTETFAFRPIPTYLFAWRRLLLSLHGASVGAGCKIYPSARIWAPWNLTVGDDAVIGPRANIYSMAKIIIGTKAVVSQDVDLIAGSHDYTRVDLHPELPLITRPIEIGANAWVCAQAFVLPGVSIGDGAVIGARAVVTRDQPAWMVCAGNPCRPLKPRTPPAHTST
jgi:putative colanic acid biosynthesis acetyltransferase WcaF